MTSCRVLVAALVLGLMPGVAGAQTFLEPGKIDLEHLLAPPPALGSAQQQAEMAELERIAQARTPQRVAQAQHDVGESVFDMFGALLGPDFQPARLPRATVLFDRLGDTEDALLKRPKEGFARTRPFLTNPALQPPGPVSKSGSYPSGHSTRSTIMGLVLAAMLPERRDEIFARMADYAESRKVLSVHYQSDIVAGRIAGTAVDAVLFTDPNFSAAYGPARAEVRAALGLTP